MEVNDQSKATGSSLFGYILRFSTVGALATIVYFVFAHVLIAMQVASEEICSVLAYMAGIVVSYIGQSKYTFRVGAKNHAQLIRFILLSAIGLTISYLSVDVAVNFYEANAIWGTALTSISIPVLSFIVMKIWVFRK